MAGRQLDVHPTQRQPLDPRTDHDEVAGAAEIAAGVRDARPHDTAHKRATVRLLLGVPEYFTLRDPLGGGLDLARPAVAASMRSHDAHIAG